MSSVTPQRSDNEPQPHLVISADDTSISRLEYLPDGQRVVTGSDDGTVKVWNLENGEQEGTSMEHESEVYDLAVTRDGTRIISSDVDGNIKVWNVESHEIVKEWIDPDGGIDIALSPDDRLIAVSDETVAFYTMEGRQVNHPIEVGSYYVSALSFSPDGKKLACCTRDDIRVYDVASGTLILGPLRGHQGYVSNVLWSRDGSRLFSASNDKTIRCWNSDTGEQIGHPWTGHTNWIRSLSLSPDGSILASASWDNTVRFWDTTTGNPIGQHLQHDNRVKAVRFSPSGESVASTGWDASGRICFWRLPWLNSITHQVITPFRCTSVFILIPPSI
jgi:WD40 repeat protein